MSSPSILDDMEKQKQAFAPVALPVDDTPLDEERAKWEAEFFFEYEAEIRMKVIASHTAGIAIANAAKVAINASQSAQLVTRHLNRDILGISKESRVKRLFKYLIIVHLIVVALAIAAFNTPYIMKSIQINTDIDLESIQTNSDIDLESIQINTDIYNTTDVSTESLVHTKQRIDEDISHAKVMAEMKSETEKLKMELNVAMLELNKQKMELNEMRRDEDISSLVRIKQRIDEEIGEKLKNAIINGSSSIVELLINAGADVNAKDNGGWTPLNGACEDKQTSIVELLINAGADVNAIGNNEGWTPLDTACYSGQVSIVELLINAGADVNAKDKENDDWTPLYFARQNGSSTIVDLLLKAGATD